MEDYTLVQPESEQPQMYSIDATKARSLEEMGMLLNALGMAMSMEYAKEKGLEHLLAQ